MPNIQAPDEEIPGLWDELRPLLETMSEHEAETSALVGSLLNVPDPRDLVGRTPLMLAYWLGNLPAGHVIGRRGENYDLLDREGHDGHWYLAHRGQGARMRGVSNFILQHLARKALYKVIEEESLAPKLAGTVHTETPSAGPRADRLGDDGKVV
ncbi:hypothetical protein [Hydrogenophaga sp. 2FB]|uniref:hypothetical protein n=1 Tax=Hydrogenophaga sp. 2FB TaxID=2502187 RepID=UPI0014859FB2|nr:hypothetical protein [Hydrogenophaga sp. 2FB]